MYRVKPSSKGGGQVFDIDGLSTSLLARSRGTIMGFLAKWKLGMAKRLSAYCGILPAW
jgi:hypothetical protein